MDKMDRDTVLKMRRWINAIAAEELTGLIGELMEFISSDVPNEILNKISFKLLQYLSHSAYKFHRTKKKLGSELCVLSNLLCTNMSSVSDTNKFFGSIYHIIACLTEMSLYFEAIEITNYLLPAGILENIAKTEKAEIYEQTSALWYKTTLEFAKSTRISTVYEYNLFVTMVKYQLDLTKLTQDNYSRNVLTKIASYWNKTRENKNFGNDLKNVLLDYIEKNSITLNDEDAPRTWRLICELISGFIDPTRTALLSFGQPLDSTNVTKKVQNFRRIFDVFRPSIENKYHYIEFHNFHEKLYKILYKPIENISRDGTNEIEAFTKKLAKFSNNEKNNPDYRVAVQWYAYTAATLLTGVLHYWEKTAKTKETMKYINDEMLIAILSLSKNVEELFHHFKLEDCTCPSKQCKIITDHYTICLLNLQCLCLISHCRNSMENEKLREITRTTSKRIFIELENMKKFGCDKWILIWPALSVQVYNNGVSCESKNLETSAKLYEYIYKGITKMVDFTLPESHWGFDHSIGTILHRLFSVHMRLGNYEKAEFFCSLNGILNYENWESKAYRDWTTLKYTYTKTSNTTMLQYLRTNEKEIAKIINNFSLEQHDLDMLCLREIKGYEESRYDMSRSIMNVLDVHSRINGKSLIYCQGVQLLGHHLLDHQHGFSKMAKYIIEAKRRYRAEQVPCIKYRLIKAMLQFYEFMIKLEDILKNAANEMKSSQFGQYPSITVRKTHENERSEMKNIVPAYNTINMTIMRELADLLKIILNSYSRLIDEEIWTAELKEWELYDLNHTIVIAGEYSRLYHFQDLEIIAWKLSYKLSMKIRQYDFTIYTVARSLTSENVNLDWITEANKLVNKYQQLMSHTQRKIMTIYKLCLANFYYENNEPELGKKCLDEVKANIIFLTDLSNFLIKLEIEMNHRLGKDENDDQTKYTCMIVQCLYTILSMDDTIEASNYYPPLSLQFRLYDYEILLVCTNNLALRMNGLLSYREITAHLVRRLRTAQKLCLPLRIAECLKFLCYLDLSRAQLEECESKLEGLEHILEIEAFGVTMRSRAPQTCRENEITTTGMLYEPVRDLGQSDASPILRKKVFAKPDFMLHGTVCACLKCINTRYQYLVFACTHIRAQLFSLQRNRQAALQHFHGALSIKRDILAKVDTENEAERGMKIGSSGAQRDAIEFIMLHVDYCRFLKWSMPKNNNDRREIAQDALELCNKYNLNNHPIFMAVKELIFEYRFESVFTKQDYSKFMVPDINAIDTSHFNIVNVPDPSICVTPVREIILKPAISVRRRKTPPFLKLDRVPDDTTDDEPPMINSRVKRARPIRRKISEDEDSSEDEEKVTIQRKKPSQPRRKPITPDETPIMVKSEDKSLIESTNHLIIAGSSTIPKVFKMPDEQIVQIDKIDDLAKMVEDLKVNPPQTNSTIIKSTRTRLRKKEPKSSGSDPTSKKIDGNTNSSIHGTIRQKSTRTQKSMIESNELNVVDQIWDGATTSEGDSDVSTKRSSSRCRKKIENLEKTRNLVKPNGDDKNTGNDIIVPKTRSGRRLANFNEQTVETINKVTTSSRSKTTRNNNT